MRCLGRALRALIGMQSVGRFHEMAQRIKGKPSNEREQRDLKRCARVLAPQCIGGTKCKDDHDKGAHKLPPSVGPHLTPEMLKECPVVDLHTVGLSLVTPF